MASDVRVAAVDLADAAQAAAFLELLDHYARDPMGGGNGLQPAVRARLVPALRDQSGFHGALAWQGDAAVGLINCFAGFSTFAAQPLLNVLTSSSTRRCAVAALASHCWPGRRRGRASSGAAS